MPPAKRTSRTSTGTHAARASTSADQASTSAVQASTSADQARTHAVQASTSADQARTHAEQVQADATRISALANPPPCGDSKHDFPDLADRGVRDPQNILVCGDAHYIHQLGADVSAAVTKLGEDFLEGKFAPETVKTQEMLCRYVSARQSRLPDEYVTKVLNTTFNDERIDGLMNSLAAIFDAFERCSCAVGQPETARLAMSTRHALVNEILEIQSVFSDKGGGGLRLVVDQAGAGLLDGLSIAGASEVQCHAGVRIADDPIATLAALADQPVAPLRARALKASAVRYVAQEVAKFPVDQKSLANLMDRDFLNLFPPVADFQAASGGASAGGETWTPTDAVAERELQAVLSRQTAGVLAFR
ncbi:MAG: hypothetical protein ACXVSL_16930 [Solirubrobacteraceae bacterium]